MKFETTPAFDRDYRRLRPAHRATFRAVVARRFAPACDACAADPATAWPASLRVKAVHGTSGVLEMTWSFASPDGRATFELISADGETRVRWRRVGGHDVFQDP
ncbi:MAG: hypothetical protein FWD74_07825 [Actinomycetia bacterium]|nr:hypothetical protein [Actinomycetes bacterium]